MEIRGQLEGIGSLGANSVTKLGGRHLYPLCHLTGPPSHTFVSLVHLVQGTTHTLLGWQRCLCCESFLQGEEVAEPRHPGWVALCLATSRSVNQLFPQLGLSRSPGEVRWFHSPLPLSVCRSPSSQIYCIENAHGQLVRDLDFNPNKQYYLASCGDDCKVKFWDTRNVTEPVKTLEEHSHWYRNSFACRFREEGIM